MATLREFLTDVAFDWENGTLVHQPVTDHKPFSYLGTTAGPGRIITKGRSHSGYEIRRRLRDAKMP